MVDSLSPENAQYVLAVFEVFLYGFSVLGFMITIWTLLRGKPWSQVNKLVLFFAVFLFAFQTMYTVVGIRRRYDGFVRLTDSYPGGPSAFFENVTTTAVLLRNIAWDLQVALGDAIVIWRAYVFWQTPWIVVPPIVIWIGFIVAAVGELLSMRDTEPSLEGLFAPSVQAWSTAALSLTMSCNILSTFLLAYRLWKLENESGGSRMSITMLKPLLVVMLDTGLLYSVWVFVAFITDILGSRFEYVFDNSLPSIISIVFFTVLLRIAWMQNLRPRKGIADSQYGGGTATLSTFSPRERSSLEMRSPPVHIRIGRLTDRCDTEHSSTDTHKEDTEMFQDV
ncbi:uncharacterized protein BT62DRAFT_1002975 [Guyanagaster necrorhizus]|uniref:Uncharacterized protein n=1 Tax=Guyanagaster necrorhizus TaxID=856835 RepID=A0A9P7VXK4_9AGAR|nr:uncharacterized protein BT62DRAFT_1002975 [Guyanagaster necrorhizus MCA 3950]KAG7449401.1 hypothetical protein BT62DRAFT_1002975 [Guyanagaster necrorhizus MCA 3950]